MDGIRKAKLKILKRISLTLLLTSFFNWKGIKLKKMELEERRALNLQDEDLNQKDDGNNFDL